MSLLRIILLTLIVLLAVVGCGTETSDDAAPSLGSPDIIGSVTEVQPAQSGDLVGTIGLEVKKVEPDVQPDKYVVTINGDTLVYRQVGEEIGDLGEVGFVALQAGQRVEVWLAGPVSESFPKQATAKFIVISGAAPSES